MEIVKCPHCGSSRLSMKQFGDCSVLYCMNCHKDIEAMNLENNKGSRRNIGIKGSDDLKDRLILAVGVAGLLMMVSSVYFGTVVFAAGLVLAILCAVYSLYDSFVKDHSENIPRTFAFGIIVLLLAAGLCYGSVVAVGAGEKGVIVNSPTGDIGEVIEEGWHFNTLYVLDNIDKIRTNSQTVEYVGQDDSDDTTGGITVLTSDNLTVDMDIAVTFHIPNDYVSQLRLKYGPDWKLTILHQEVRSIPRLVCAQFTALEIVGEDREYVEEAIRSRLSASIEEKGIIVDNVIIRELRIPDVLTDAVEQKLAAQQKLEKAQIDLERIQIEAQASAEAVDKVRSQFESDEAYLQYMLYQNLKDMDGVQVVLSDGGIVTAKVV